MPLGHLIVAGVLVFLFKHISHCSPQKQLGLPRGLTIIQISVFLKSGSYTKQTKQKVTTKKST